MPASEKKGECALRTRVVVFTDLDGTLLDHATYSFAAALPALDLLESMKIPLVICSSKTAGEIEHYRGRLGNRDPYISENGGGVFIPRNYFSRAAPRAGPVDTPAGSAAPEGAADYDVVRLGASYGELRRAVESLRRQGYPIRGFGDMTPEEVSRLTGLPLEQSVLARRRDFDEPFIMEKGATVPEGLVVAIEDLGFKYTAGRLGHLMGSSDKGRAVTLVAHMYDADAGGDVTTIGIGDAPNDAPMLRAVDLPVAVQQPDGSYGCASDIPGLVRAEGAGPIGWNRAVVEMVGRLSGR